MGLILDAIAAVVVVGGAVYLYRMATWVAPGWKVELRQRDRVVKVLDKPGFYMVNPFLARKRARIDAPPKPE
jgi:regulator of protease activity HflC (stomatin/prohibitin superfamily)